MPYFVVVEGVDGSGKTTQARRLAARFREDSENFDGVAPRVVETHEPTRLPIGTLIRRYLAGEVDLDPRSLVFLFSADRADHVAKVLRPALEDSGVYRETVVVCDRYVPSTCVYQRANMPVSKIATLNAEFPIPDVVVLLKVSAAVAIERIAERGRVDAFDKAATEQSIGMQFSAYAASLRLLGWRTVIVDADGTPDEVESKVWEAVNLAFDDVENEEGEAK